MAKILIEPVEKYGLSSKSRKKTLFSKIGVVGCGKEGQNIARIAAFHGLEVVFLEVSETRIKNAIEAISMELDDRIESWGLTNTEKKLILSRITGTLEYKDLGDCEFIIEAVRRDFYTGERSIDHRKVIFKNIEEVVSPECIIATNATTLIITELSSELQYKERCVSLHFFMSSPEARIVEVVRGLYTSEDVYNKVLAFVKMINRDVIAVEESVGMVSIRLIMVTLNEACNIFMEGVATLESINKVTKIGLGHRFGIFHLADIIGLDKIVRWGENLFEEYGQEKYKPSPLLKRLVRAKQVGVECGKGFFKYDNRGRRIIEE